jgi:hypothetical protein
VLIIKNPLLPAIILFLIEILSGTCFSQSTWESQNPLPNGSFLISLTYGNNQFVALGRSCSIWTSPNGKIWSIKNSGIAKDLESVAYGDSQFVAVGRDGIFTSSDGALWALKMPGISKRLNAVIYADSQFVTVGDSGTILTSVDGATWVIKKSGTTNDLFSVTYGNKQFLIVGGNGGTYGEMEYPNDYSALLISSDGTTWRQIYTEMAWQRMDLSPETQLRSVAYGNSQTSDKIGRFVAVGFGSLLVSSPNAETWTKTYISDYTQFHSVIFGNGQFVAIGTFGTEDRIFTSFDGTTWTIKNSGTTDLVSVGYGNGRFVAVGVNGTILTSEADPVGVAFQTKARRNCRNIKINIVKNSISIILPNVTAQSHLKVELFNVSGKQIYSAISGIQNRILNIPAKQFPAGKYFISITDENNKTFNSAFILPR